MINTLPNTKSKRLKITSLSLVIWLIGLALRKTPGKKKKKKKLIKNNKTGNVCITHACLSPTWTALSLSSLWYVKTFPLSTKKRSCQFFTMDLCFFSQPFFTGVSMDLLKPVWVDPGLPSPGITLLERAEVETDKKQAEYKTNTQMSPRLAKNEMEFYFYIMHMCGDDSG